MSPAEARAFALSLPEVTEEPHFEKTSFRVRGKIFATLPPEGEYIHLFLDEILVHALVSEDPGTFEELRWGSRLIGTRARIAAVGPERLRELLEEAWRHKAPKRLAQEFHHS